MNLKFIKNVKHFIDDICIHTDSIESNIKICIQVFERIIKSDLKINLDKCEFFKLEINILGHVISFNKIMMDPAKVKAVINRSPPKTVKQLEKFLGLTNYFHVFIQNYSETVLPLYNLKRKNVKFVWSTECHDAFNLLKRKLTEYPVLRPADLNKIFRLHTDC